MKSYISEGRQIIRSIETETYADNPPLFREYMTARPDIRLLMDNQFRNVKTHARLLSKAMWYEWRMKLLEGLKEGLDRHLEEMKADDSALSKQERILDSVVPALVEKHSSAESEATKLQEIVDEMENCDQDELRTARERLATVDAEIAAKKKQLEEMQEAYTDRVDTIEAGTELKAEFMEQIREADRVREECRGWSVREVNTLRGESDGRKRSQHFQESSKTDSRRFCLQVRKPIWLVYRFGCQSKARFPSGACFEYAIQRRAASYILSQGIQKRRGDGRGRRRTSV